MKVPEPLVTRVAKRALVACILVGVAACGGGSSSDSVSESEPVQSFAGTVQCDSIGVTPQSQVWETRVIFDRSVYPGMASEVSQILSSAEKTFMLA